MKRLFLFSILCFFILGTTNVTLANDKVVKPKKVKLIFDNDYYNLANFSYSYTFHLSCYSDNENFSYVLSYYELTEWWNL